MQVDCSETIRILIKTKYQVHTFATLSSVFSRNAVCYHKSAAGELNKYRLTITSESIDHLRIAAFYLCEQIDNVHGNKCGALRNLVPFVQFKKREKHPWRSVTFTATLLKVTLLYRCFGRFKLYKWYQIAQSTTNTKFQPILLN